MLIKIGGDTLALDLDIRRQIEAEASQLAARFPGPPMEGRATIQEEFDQLHGRRIRFELFVKPECGRQVVIREARKNATEAIREAFIAARRSLRRNRYQRLASDSPAHQTVITPRSASSPHLIPPVPLAGQLSTS